MRAALAALLLVAACTDPPSGAVDAGGPPPPDAWPPPPDAAPPIACVDPASPFTWPFATAPVDVPAHASWKGDLVADDPFATGSPVPWVKFVVLTADPSRVFFFDGATYDFHYEFAVARLPPFLGMSPADFDAATVRLDGQIGISGTVLLPFDADDFGIQLTLHDDVHPAYVAQVLELVAAHVAPGSPWVYLPDERQAACLGAHEDFYAARGIAVGRADRWLRGDGCYAPGWAIGRLVALAPEEVDAAWVGGALRPEDILLVRGPVPTEVPFVKGILTTVPSSGGSHVAILARSSGVPFFYLRQPGVAARAEALAGRQVVVKATRQVYDPERCDVSLIDVEEVDPALLEEIAALLVPAPLALEPVGVAGTPVLPIDGLGAGDVGLVGGKAVGVALLRGALPDEAPDPALALTFDAFAPFRRPLPATTSLVELDTALASIRDDIEATPFPDALAWELLAALAHDFDPDVRLRFRSSTNVEDGLTFTGAGLYDSATGCVADDLDADDVGPSRCNPWQPEERGALRAIKKVYASFYRRNAVFERIRRGVDEAQVGMAVVVHPSTPDATEAANGVALVSAPDDTGWRYVTLISQVGATSVTNPEGLATPEVIRQIAGHAMNPLELESYSSLLPLGQTVLAEDEYAWLMDRARIAATAWRQTFALSLDDAPPLELEWKKLTSGDFTIKQVRAVPPPVSWEDQPRYFIGAPVRRCTHQGRSWSVLDTHAAKAILEATSRDLRLDEASLATGAYETRRLDVAQHGALVALEDPPDSREVGLDGNDEPYTREVWTVGGISWTFETYFSTWTRADAPVFDGRDLSPVVHVGPAAAGVFEICPDEAIVEHGWIPNVKSWTAPGGVTIETSYWWPPNLTGQYLGGFTYALGKWDGTTITGLTSTPIVLTGYWSQTYGPGTHNFHEELLFEPRLEEGIDPAIVAELEAQDIAAIIVVDADEWTDMPPAFQLIGLDGTIRPM